MIYSHGTLSAREIDGVYETLDDQDHMIKWFFRDDGNGVKFVYYAKWLDEYETDINQLIMGIFERFCNKNEVEVNEVLCTRLTLTVQNDDSSEVIPEEGYPQPIKTFLYFVSGSDRNLIVEGKQVVPKIGGGIVFDGPYKILPPHKENFFIIAEVQFK